MYRSCFKILTALVVVSSICCFAESNLSAQDEQANDVDIRKQLLENIKESLSKLEKLDGKDTRQDHVAQLALYSAVKNFVAPGLKRRQQLLGGVNYYEMLPDQRNGGLWTKQNPRTLIATSAVEYMQRLQANVGMNPSPYWIGIQCDSAEKYEVKVSDSHVVTAEGGLKINAVTSDSPAESAGIETGDVIVFLNEKPTNNIVELVAAIDQCKDTQVDVVVVRDQEMITLEIVPALRKVGEDSDDIEQPSDSEQANIVIDFAMANQTIPESFEAVVRFKLGEPLSITIKNDEEEWEVETKASVDQLPQDAQPFANHVFKANSSWVDTNPNPLWTAGGYPDGVYEVVPQSWNRSRKIQLQLVDPDNHTPETTESRLDQIQDQLEQLSEAIKELRNRD